MTKEPKPPLIKEVGKCLKCSGTISAEMNDDGTVLFLDDAGEVTLDFGYGSEFDTDLFKAYICDNCMSDTILNDSVVEYVENTLGDTGEDRGLESLKKSLQKRKDLGILYDHDKSWEWVLAGRPDKWPVDSGDDQKGDEDGQDKQDQEG